MDALLRYKKQVQDYVKRTLNQPLDQPNIVNAQGGMTQDEITRILTLPALMLPPPQDLDPASPTFGRTYFVAGVHPLGDENYPIGPDP